MNIARLFEEPAYSAVVIYNIVCRDEKVCRDTGEDHERHQ